MFTALISSAQPKTSVPPPAPLEQAEGMKQAQSLVANLLAQKPAQNSTNDAVMRIRDAEGKRSEIPVKCLILPSPTNYLTIYQTPNSSKGPGGMKLTIIHSEGQPNQYMLSEAANATGTASEQKQLSGAQLMLPFSGSDFWVADLGLEFLHWPQQRVLRKEMRRSTSCDVLESINPQPSPGGYTRVLSWIGINHPGETVLVHADAFDDRGKVLKQFDPKSLEKVNGAWQLESMEMQNVQTDSRTMIEFNLK